MPTLSGLAGSFVVQKLAIIGIMFVLYLPGRFLVLHFDAKYTDIWVFPLVSGIVIGVFILSGYGRLGRLGRFISGRIAKKIQHSRMVKYVLVFDAVIFAWFLSTLMLMESASEDDVAVLAGILSLEVPSGGLPGIPDVMEHSAERVASGEGPGYGSLARLLTDPSHVAAMLALADLMADGWYSHMMMVATVELGMSFAIVAYVRFIHKYWRFAGVPAGPGEG